ncbi:3-oxoacyl-ACP reductase [Leucobacter sp. GX24907]
MSEANEPGAPVSNEGADDAQRPPAMPVSQPALVKALWWGIGATVLLLLVWGGIGFLVAGREGLTGGTLGAAFAGIFTLLTVGSIAFANRFIESDLYIPMFFGIVLGTWILKFIGFIIAILLLRGQPWLDPLMFFLALVSGVLVSLVIDVVVVARSRIPVISPRFTED